MVLFVCNCDTSFIKLIILIICLINVANGSPLEAYKTNSREKNLVEIENLEFARKTLQDLLRDIMNSKDIYYSNPKRGLDFGLSRGFSGRQAAKHLVGLANAQFADGPGKR